MDRTYETVQSKLAPEMREAESVKEVIETAATLWPNRTYVTDGPTGQTYSFNNVNTRANELAAGLTEIGVEEGDRVGLYLTNGPAYVIAIYACAKIGAVQTPINWQYREREVEHVFDTAGLTAIVVESNDEYLDILDSVVSSFPETESVVVLDDETPRTVDGAETYAKTDLTADVGDPAVATAPSDPVSILYTSGTTGMPKPAVHSNESYLLAAKSFLGAPLPEDDVNYNPFPLFHANAQCYSMLGKALHGSGYVLADRFSGSAFFDHVVPMGVTSFNVLGGVPKMLAAKYDEDEIPDNNLELAIGPIGTEQWTPFEEQFDLTVVQIYSQTENPTLPSQPSEPREDPSRFHRQADVPRPWTRGSGSRRGG